MSAPRRLPTIAPYDLPVEADLPPSRADWPLEPRRAALLVHDMQAYFLGAFQPDEAPLVPLIRNIAALVEAVRAAGVPVFYTAQRGNQDPRDRGLQGDLWGPGMHADPAHESIVEPLAPQGDDIVLVKHRYSAFKRSNLETLMRARGRDQLLICGVYAHIGCLATAFEAFQRDVHPFMIADGLADFSSEWHDSAIRTAADCCAVVTSTVRALERLT